MILAFDTYYYEDKAKTVCIQFDEWTSASQSNFYIETLEGVEEYVAGQFYKRELPCILSLLRQIDLSDVSVIVVDGYVYLDDDKKFGLGGHLYNALSETIPVIGVAKSDFKQLTSFKKVLYRGKSTKPLYITSIGIDDRVAIDAINSMFGTHRLPTLLKILDTATKTV